jgi:hypothetical protein
MDIDHWQPCSLTTMHSVQPCVVSSDMIGMLICLVVYYGGALSVVRPTSCTSKFDIF